MSIDIQHSMKCQNQICTSQNAFSKNKLSIPAKDDNIFLRKRKNDVDHSNVHKKSENGQEQELDVPVNNFHTLLNKIGMIETMKMI